jgi:putative Flp pilus-assembly TadE/G-like protein
MLSREALHTMKRCSERGAVLIHVAFLLLGAFLFSMFSVDYGMLWLARREAQNAADAAALAGAIARAYDDPDPNPSTTSGKVWGSTTQTAARHLILGTTVEPSTVEVSYTCPDGTTKTCVRADVFRDGTHTSTPLPVFFAHLAGISSQNIRASAIAQAKAGNFSECLKPWMIPDRWVEGMAPASEFNPPGDTYVKPGYTLMDVGTVITLKPGDPSMAISPSDYYEIDTATNYEENITGCLLQGGLGDVMRVLPGNRVGPTKMATQDLIDQDPDAMWDGTKVVGGCSPNCPGDSPRKVAIAMFDPAEFEMQKRQSGTFPITIVNLMGFFIMSVDNRSNVTGVLIGKAGSLRGSGGEPDDDAAFLKVIVLVR